MPAAGAAGSGEVSVAEGDDHRAFVESLPSHERMLITLRDELYEGSWERMWQDLDDRLHERPYIFKLSNRIKADMAAIESLRAYEQAHGVNLRDYLTGDEG
jgi:hypothetical protein